MDINRGDDKLVHFDPPDQWSHKHILNALNNFCIQEIFRRLQNIGDFVSVAEVCIRFQDNARKCFPPIYKVFYFDNHPSESNKDLVLPLNRVQSFLTIFGDLIETIVWGDIQEIVCLKPPYERDNRNLRILAENCGKSVTELKIRGRFIDFNILNRFQALETLEIEYTSGESLRREYSILFFFNLFLLCINYFKASKPEPFSKLKRLKMSELLGDRDWLKQTFPKLIEAEFIDIIKDEIKNENTLIEFINQNPQLQRLTVSCIDRFVFHPRNCLEQMLVYYFRFYLLIEEILRFIENNVIFIFFSLFVFMQKYS